MHTHSLILPATPPFDFTHSLAFVAGFSPTSGEQTVTDAALTKTVAIGGAPVVFEVRAAKTFDAPALACSLWSDRAFDLALVVAATDRIRFFLGLDDDLGPFYALAAQDSPFVPIIERLRGYHQVKFLTPFENAVWAVLTQRNPMPLARRAKETLSTRYAPRLVVVGQRPKTKDQSSSPKGMDTSRTDAPQHAYQTFPEAVTIAALDVAEIEAAINNRQKARTIAAVAAAFANVNEAWLRNGPVEDVQQWLLSIKGIGPWSAAFVLIRGLGRMELLPTEARLAEAATRVYGKPVSERDLPQLAERYGNYRGYWAHYLRVAG